MYDSVSIFLPSRLPIPLAHAQAPLRQQLPFMPTLCHHQGAAGRREKSGVTHAHGCWNLTSPCSGGQYENGKNKHVQSPALLITHSSFQEVFLYPAA